MCIIHTQSGHSICLLYLSNACYLQGKSLAVGKCTSSNVLGFNYLYTICTFYNAQNIELSLGTEQLTRKETGE